MIRNMVFVKEGRKALVTFSDGRAYRSTVYQTDEFGIISRAEGVSKSLFCPWVRVLQVDFDDGEVLGGGS